jgi:hypothetical protein
MGATIHWSLRASKSAAIADVGASLGALREACLDLPFDYVTDVVCFGAAEIARRLKARSDPFRWLLVQSGASVRLESADREEVWSSINPIALVGFTASPGEKCEPMNCFLALYPEQVDIGRQSVRPGIDGWRGSSFAKTQYASTVTVENFLKCHLTIVAALDAAMALGLLESVVDETDFRENRDIEKLVTTLMTWNTRIAGFVGSLELATGKEIYAPIKKHPEFERLEHHGTTNDTAVLARAIAAMIKRDSPTE